MANRQAFNDDPEYPLLHALERNYDKGVSKDVARTTGADPREPSAEKAAIFSKRVISPRRDIRQVETAKDAMVVSMNELGRVDMPLMTRLCGKTQEEMCIRDSWSDEPSLITICREVVADEVLAAIDVDPTWDAVHHVLAGHGMQIRKSGPNSWQLDAMKEDAGEIIHLPASKALRKLQLGKLAERLGEFLPAPGPLRPPAERASRHTEAGTAPQERGPSKRDPDKRMVRRLQRAELRTSLIERYRAEKMKAVEMCIRDNRWGLHIQLWAGQRRSVALACPGGEVLTVCLLYTSRCV